LGNPSTIEYTFGVNSKDKAYQDAYKNFLARLIEARKQAGLTQVDVAKRLGRAHSFISKCELGERRVRTRCTCSAMRYAILRQKH